MSAFVALMRRYVNDYTNRQCLSVCDDIMHPDYTLRMGDYVLSGRDECYKPAAQKQFKQFPGLCLTVHHIITNGERLLMQFSEHGASVEHGGATAAWAGIGLYRWDGERLRENYVEQDYLSRRRQLAEHSPLFVESPALAPWDTQAAPADPALEQWTRQFLADGGLDLLPATFFDDGYSGVPIPQMLQNASVDIDDLFSAGDHVAFRLTQSGVLASGSGLDSSQAGCTACLHMVGWLQVSGGQVVRARIIRDRLGLLRRLRNRVGK